MKSVLICLLLFATPPCFSQDSVQRRIGVQCMYHPYDFFIGVHYIRHHHFFEHQFQLGTGISHTFSQARPYPQLSYQFSALFFQTRFFRSGAFVRPVVSCLNVQKSSRGINYFEEGFAGLFAGIGNRTQVRISAGFGPSFEQFWGAQVHHFVNYSSWHFMGEISCSYAL